MSAAGLNLDQVAEFLLRNQYLLTSLELHQESIERGQELQRLKTLFTPSKLDGVIATEEQSSWNAATAIMRPPRGNAGKGTPGAQTTVELANRVALLEYELRQERQTIQELRSELSKQFAAKESLPSNQVTDASAYRKTQPASSIESRILNHLIKKYLISQGYKLTAISLASEVRKLFFQLKQRFCSIFKLQTTRSPINTTSNQKKKQCLYLLHCILYSKIQSRDKNTDRLCSFAFVCICVCVCLKKKCVF